MSREDETRVDSARSPYKRHRYPAEIIAHCVWLYYRFTLSFRDVEELMLARGIVAHETIRTWCAKFGPEYARGLRRRAPEPGDTWFLDEVFVKIGGIRHYSWRAVDQDGNVLDVLVQSRRNAKAAKRFFVRADAQAGPGAEGAGDRQARQLRCGASGVDTIGRTPALEVPQQPGRELAPTHQTARTRHEVLPLTWCRTTAPGGVQRDLAALPTRPTQAHRERLPLRNDRPIRHLERRHRRTRRLNLVSHQQNPPQYDRMLLIPNYVQLS
ncbi:DDE domain-containing protein [Rhodococcus qingshengii]|nr:DDE domain-containing protein [Rhodococcus qingshengii]